MLAIRFAAVLSLSVLLLSGVQAGERTYRWVDDKGRVHYSDVPREKSERVEIKPGSSIQAAPKDSPDALAAKQLECQRKKDQLAVYSSSAEINETDGLGRSRTYSAEEKAQLVERTRQQMTVLCDAAGVSTDPASNASLPQ